MVSESRSLSGLVGRVWDSDELMWSNGKAGVGDDKPPQPFAPNRMVAKEADARLDAAFDRSLAGRDVDRRGWQILDTLASSPTPRDELVASLTAFDSPALPGRRRPHEARGRPVHPSAQGRVPVVSESSPSAGRVVRRHHRSPARLGSHLPVPVPRTHLPVFVSSGALFTACPDGPGRAANPTYRLTAYRALLNRCEGRPTVPEERVPVPCRWGSMARRKVSF
jgi:hypothetical protein